MVINSANFPQDKSTPQFGVQLKEKTRLASPPLFQVLLHNDPITPRWFVVAVLGRCFSLNETKATEIMMKAHRTGVALVGVYPREMAETRVERALKMAEENDFPLLFTIEEIEINTNS